MKIWKNILWEIWRKFDRTLEEIEIYIIEIWERLSLLIRFLMKSEVYLRNTCQIFKGNKCKRDWKREFCEICTETSKVRLKFEKYSKKGWA